MCINPVRLACVSPVNNKYCVADRPLGGQEGALPGQPGEGRVQEQEGEAVRQGEVMRMMMMIIGLVRKRKYTGS